MLRTVGLRADGEVEVRAAVVQHVQEQVGQEGAVLAGVLGADADGLDCVRAVGAGAGTRGGRRAAEPDGDAAARPAEAAAAEAASSGGERGRQAARRGGRRARVAARAGGADGSARPAPVAPARRRRRRRRCSGAVPAWRPRGRNGIVGAELARRCGVQAGSRGDATARLAGAVRSEVAVHAPRAAAAARPRAVLPRRRGHPVRCVCAGIGRPAQPLEAAGLRRRRGGSPPWRCGRPSPSSARRCAA